MAINLIGGLILGLVAGLTLAHSAETFSVLSVGDALVSQLPALLISAASGIVVTRSATGEPLGRAFATQLLGRRRAVVLTAGILTALAMIPGVPALPCLALAGSLFLLARSLPPEGGPSRRRGTREARGGKAQHGRGDRRGALGRPIGGGARLRAHQPGRGCPRGYATRAGRKPAQRACDRVRRRRASGARVRQPATRARWIQASCSRETRSGLASARRAASRHRRRGAGAAN